MPKDHVARLDRCMYGTRDAGAIWETVYTDALISLGFKQGFASPCCFSDADLEVPVVVHGNDFTALGCVASLDVYERGMKNLFEIKLTGRIGSGPN